MTMWQVAHILIKTCATTLALACFFTAKVLYPDEQGKIQNKLEEWWIEFDDAQKQSLSKAAVFMRGLATLTNNALNLAFGIDLVSLRAFVVSAYLSLGSIYLAVIFYFFYSGEYAHHEVIFWWEVIGVGVAVSSFALAMASLSARYVWARRFLAALLLGWLAASYRGFLNPAGGESAIWFSAALSAGVLSDVGFVLLTRAILKWCERANVGVASVLVFVSNITLGLILCIIPAASNSILGVRFGENVGFFALILSMSNAFDFLLSTFLAIAAIVLLLHRLLWPVAVRSLYALSPSDAHKKLLLGVGGALVTAVFGEPVWKLLKEFL